MHRLIPKQAYQLLNLFGLCWLFITNQAGAQETTLPAGFAQELLIDGINPVAMTMDHHGRVWISEKNGKVLIVNENGELLPDPFLQLAVDDFNERGLLGIALHPDVDNQPYLYLYYTVPALNHNRVSRFTINGDFAVPGSETILLELDVLTGVIHNGGALAFGPDDKLYIATGDGANPPNAQNLNTLLGKILRINPDGSIPEDNPFYEQNTGKYRSIWAYGLRNPFSMDINPENGRIFVCDVGLGDAEEVNDILPGKNYGWPLVEGYATGQEIPEHYMEPFYAYSHDEGCAIVGAAFYLPQAFHFPAAYMGKFFFADYCRSYIHFLDPETGMLDGVFATNVARPLAFKVNETTGELYYLSRAGIGGGSAADNTSTQSGSLWKIFYSGNGIPFISVNPSSTYLPQGEDAIFQVRALGSAELLYQWQKDGINLPGADSSVLIYPAINLADDGSAFRCIVSNDEGLDTSTTAILSVTANQRPIPVISLPGTNATFSAGDTLFFAGSASDPEDGSVPLERLCWRIDLHHHEHTHPALNPTCGQEAGYFPTPQVNETDTDIWYRVYLTAEDADGFQQTTFQEIYPEYTDITIDGPNGIAVNIDGKLRNLPHTFASLNKLQRVVQVPLTQQIGDTLYLFSKWEDGTSNPLKTFFAEADHPIHRVLYDVFPYGKGEGLWGEYFPGLGFDNPGGPLLSRIDTAIQFLWQQDTPMPDSSMIDYYSVRWTGSIQSVFTEDYTFYIRADDGVRLWVGDSLLIDRWVAQPATEYQATFSMEAGHRYPIRIEYFELTEIAEVSLWWSSDKTPKTIIPKSQLFLPGVAESSEISGYTWLDKNDNQLIDPGEAVLPNITVLALDALNHRLLAAVQSNQDGLYTFVGLTEGNYQLQFTPGPGHELYTPLPPLDEQGISPPLLLRTGESIRFDAPYLQVDIEQPTDLAGASIFPNPTSGLVNLHVMATFQRELAFELFDLSGRALFLKKTPLQLGKNQVELDLSNYPRGIYFLRLNDGISERSLKVVRG